MAVEVALADDIKGDPDGHSDGRIGESAQAEILESCTRIQKHRDGDKNRST
jgi:hypothetical protein